MTKLDEKNKDIWVRKHGKSYKNAYPCGYVIRFYEKFLKYELNKLSGKLLDFGCANGANSCYFNNKGFQIYGVDVAPNAIRQAKKLNIGTFRVIEPNGSIDVFKTKFDIIFAGQSLYYLSNMNKTLGEMDNLLNPDGVVLFSMMGRKNYYYKHSFPVGDGFRKVILKGRLNETTYINFTESKRDLIKKFHMFKPYFIGHYDISMREGSGFHYQFIGLKR